MNPMSRWLAGFTVAFLAAFALNTSASGVELRYRWKKGATYRFQVVSNDSFSLSGMGVGMSGKFKTDSVFSLAIDRVLPDGSAEATLNIESFDLRDQSGRKLSGLKGLPPRALKNPVKIDEKGNFTFQEIVYLIVEESGASSLVSGRVSPTGVSATGQAGDEQVSCYAEFDPRTGALKAGYSVKTVGKKKQKKIAVKQNAQKVDLVPRQFLELLRLPEGDLSAGQAFDTTLASYKISTEVEEITDKEARLKVSVSTSVAGSGQGGGAPGAGAMPGMPGGMPGMPKVPGMPAMPSMGDEGDEGGAEDDDGAASPALPAGAAMPSLSIDGTFRLTFDLTENMFSRLEGTLKTKAGMGGMASMDSESAVQMTRIKK